MVKLVDAIEANSVAKYKKGNGEGPAQSFSVTTRKSLKKLARGARRIQKLFNDLEIPPEITERINLKSLTSAQCEFSNSEIRLLNDKRAMGILEYAESRCKSEIENAKKGAGGVKFSYFLGTKRATKAHYLIDDDPSYSKCIYFLPNTII